MRCSMEHSSARAICSNVSHRTSRHWNVRALFLFGSALIFSQGWRSSSGYPRRASSFLRLGLALLHGGHDAEFDELADRVDVLDLALLRAVLRHLAGPLAVAIGLT